MKLNRLINFVHKTNEDTRQTNAYRREVRASLRIKEIYEKNQIKKFEKTKKECDKLFKMEYSRSYNNRSYDEIVTGFVLRRLREIAETLAKISRESENPETRTQALDLVKQFNENMEYLNDGAPVNIDQIRDWRSQISV